MINILMDQIIFELLIYKLANELTFVNIISPPTPIARTLTGSDFTNQADIEQQLHHLSLRIILKSN